MDILVIPDSHARPGITNNRYGWLAHLAAHRRPDVIVNLGDWYDMPSLSPYDKGKKSFEGRRYKNDIAAGNNAISIFENTLAKLTGEEAARTKRARYRPVKHALGGNHEERILRAVNNQAELEGVIGYRDFLFTGSGWTFHDFMVPLVLRGVAFAHCFGSGVMNRPIGGENPGASLIKKKLHTCVAGHSHLRDFAERTDVNGGRMQGLFAGCFLEPDQIEEYAGEAQKLWWNGVVYLHNVDGGSFDPEFIGIDRVKQGYV